MTVNVNLIVQHVIKIENRTSIVTAKNIIVGILAHISAKIVGI